jgi:hypothetical protein
MIVSRSLESLGGGLVKMKSIIVLVLCLAFCPLAFGALPANTDGYVAFGAGQVRIPDDSFVNVTLSGGLRYITKSGAGVGAELGVATPQDNWRQPTQNAFGLFSPNGYFVFPVKNNDKIKPFVTGGYTRFFGNDAGMNAGNFGGGVNYWGQEKRAVLFEFRHYIGSQDIGSAQSQRVNFWTLRLGVSFK